MERDGGLPDLGYHYPALDYAVDSLTVVQGGSLNDKPGVAIGVFGYHGLVVEDYGRIELKGAAMNRIQVVPYAAVQEQSAVWGDNQYAPSLVLGPPHAVISGHDSPDVELRFADFVVLGGRGNGVAFQNNWFAAQALVARDCRFYGGYTFFGSHYTQPAVFDVSNNLFWRTTDKFYGWLTLDAYNNLFWGGTSQLASYNAGAWAVRDNAFHDTSLTGSSSYISRGYNAYLGAVSSTPPGWGAAGDVSLATFNYTTGPLGDFYHASTELKNQGSLTAGEASLYHHTTEADGAKEGAAQTGGGIDLLEANHHYSRISSKHASGDEVNRHDGCTTELLGFRSSG